MAILPLWMWVVATVGWCGSAMVVSFMMARQGRGPVRGKKLAMMVPFLVLPFMLLSALLPWANARVTLNFTYCWVTPCKLFLLCVANFLLDSPAWTLSGFSHFLLATLLPVRIRGVVKGGVVGLSSMRIRPLLMELGALTAFLSWYDAMGSAVSHGAHCLALYLVLDLPHRIASIGFEALYGVETHPAFCEPWFSTSITDFWGHRWDLTANALLRHSVYNPIVNLARKAMDIPPLHLQSAAGAPPPPAPDQQCSTKADAKPLALLSSLVSPPTKPLPLAVRLVGVNTTFFVSGLIHELLYFSLTQAAAPTWEVTAFFIVHGLATSAEITLRRLCPSHAIFCKMPKPLKIVLTMGFMYATTAWLFFPQLVRAGIFKTCTVEFRALQKMLGIRSFNANMLLSIGSC